MAATKKKAKAPPGAQGTRDRAALEALVAERYAMTAVPARGPR